MVEQDRRWEVEELKNNVQRELETEQRARQEVEDEIRRHGDALNYEKSARKATSEVRSRVAEKKRMRYFCCAIFRAKIFDFGSKNGTEKISHCSYPCKELESIARELETIREGKRDTLARKIHFDKEIKGEVESKALLQEQIHDLDEQVKQERQLRQQMQSEGTSHNEKRESAP